MLGSAEEVFVMYLDYDDYARQPRFSTDVVVVGTGAGGAAAGTELAARGLDVLFVEEGSHTPTSSFNPFARESVPRLYRDAGATVILGRPVIPFVEGRCVGGSTVVNGGMAYRAPERILAQWKKRGLEELGPKKLEPLFEEVEHIVHAGPQLELSVGEDSRLMTEGARRLGDRYTLNRRNQEACVGSNNCTLGCPTGAKQSTLVSYLPRAFAKGARCLTEVRVEELIVRGGRCVGVRGRAINPRTRRADRPVEIHARAVVLACGAIQTPHLLLSQRTLRRVPELGKNLTLHPNSKVVAIYPFDVVAWKGVSQNTQVKEFEDEGLVFAENFVPPSVLAAYLPLLGDSVWTYMMRYNQMVVSGVLMEDSTTGYVQRRFGMPEIRYDITAADHRRMLRGIELLGELHFTMGAEEVLLPLEDAPRARSIDELRSITRNHSDLTALELFTVHLMGTARMGTSPRDSVVDSQGQLWELPGCYVADASLLPTALGVNPQLTIMALATHVARSLTLPQAA